MMDQRESEVITKIRAAIKDRATWLALLYRSFKAEFPEDAVERLARKAIFEFGRLKAAKDPVDFSPRAWVERTPARFTRPVRVFPRPWWPCHPATFTALSAC